MIGNETQDERLSFQLYTHVRKKTGSETMSQRIITLDKNLISKCQRAQVNSKSLMRGKDLLRVRSRLLPRGNALRLRENGSRLFAGFFRFVCFNIFAEELVALGRRFLAYNPYIRSI